MTEKLTQGDECPNCSSHQTRLDQSGWWEPSVLLFLKFDLFVLVHFDFLGNSLSEMVLSFLLERIVAWMRLNFSPVSLGVSWVSLNFSWVRLLSHG